MLVETVEKCRRLAAGRAAAAALAGALLTAACAQIGFHLPGNPVPVTMQVFAVLLCGMLLGARLGAISQIEYLAVGAAGAPVFAGFKGGPAVLAGPTGGYLFGFVAAAFVVGLLADGAGHRSFARLWTAGLVGVGIVYLFGRAWLSLWLQDASGVTSWALGVAPFVGIDALKAAAAAIICTRKDRWT